MTAIIISLSIPLLFAALAFITSYICFYRIFLSKRSNPVGGDKIEIPDGEIYEVHRPRLEAWVREYREKPHLDVDRKSVV